MTDDCYVDSASCDTVGERIALLKRMFPEAVAEGQLNPDTLLALLGADANSATAEQYRFEWSGKLDSLRLAQKRSTATLLPRKGESVAWDTTANLYIEGDNLEVLKLLQRSYKRKVKMIYIDPPYNTGNDFVYADDFADPIKAYKTATAQTHKANPETAGRYHSRWLSMIYPRLLIARTLLRDDGVIFISIDDNEVHNLRKICDEVFGEENFVGELVWERAYAPKNDAKYISNSHDYVLMYARTISDFQIGRLERTDEANARYQNLDNDPRGVWKPSDMSVKTYNPESDYQITTPTGRAVEPPTGRCWSLSKNAFLERLSDNRIWFGAEGNSVPCIKRFLSELKFDGMAPQSIMFYKDVGHSQEGSKEVTSLLAAGAFDGPKPIRLLRRLLRLANTDTDDLVLDFFSGSGTTAHAVMQLNAEDGGNRKFLMVQMPEMTDEKSEAFKAGYPNICEIGKERIRRAGARLKEEAGLTTTDLDTGFRTFALDTSNFKEWDETYVAADFQAHLFKQMEQQLDHVKPDRSTLDVLYEILLKQGIELTAPLAKFEAHGKTFYVVGADGDLLICLDKQLTVEIIESVVGTHAPRKIICARTSFADANATTNVTTTLKKREIEFRWV